MKKAAGNGKALLLVFVAALTLEATALVQFYFSQNGIREEAEMRAEGQLDATANKILDVTDQAEAAAVPSDVPEESSSDAPGLKGEV